MSLRAPGARPGEPRQWLGDARAMIALLLDDERVPRSAVVADVVLLALGQVLILASANDAIAAYREGLFPGRAAVLFALGMGLAAWAESSLRTRASRIIARAVAHRQRRLFAEFRRTGLASSEAIGAARIRRSMTVDAARVLEAGPPVVLLVSSTAVTLFTLIYALVGDSQTLTLFLLLAGLSAFPITQVGVNAERLAADFERGRQTLFDQAGATIDGFAQTKVHRPRAEALGAAYAEAVEGHVTRGESMYRNYNVAGALNLVLTFGLLGGIGLVYARAVPDASVDIDRLILSALFVFEPIAHIVLDQLNVTRCGSALARIEEVLAEFAASPGEDPAPAPLARGATPARFESLEARGITFTYPTRSERGGFAIGPIDLTLTPGEIVFVTGANGSGKSTLLKVLVGLYARDDGRCLLDGRDLAPMPPADYRALFSAIFGDFVLFEAAYGMRDADPAEVHRLLATMGLAEAVTFAGGRFSTVDLSTGQRKRLALVIALLQDRPIHVFDEWAADQDPAFRDAFYREVLPMLRARGKAIIAVTHDDHYFDCADRRLHLAHGALT